MLRVIAGEHRGRRLVTPEGRATRPTSDRVRESLFNLLGGVDKGARVLDLFAGSGALGIEALSRGAAEAVFVENARGALRALRENLHVLGLESRATVVAADAWSDAPVLRGPFDLVVADPPYTERWEERVLAQAAPRLLPRGIVAIEHPSERAAPEPPNGLALWKARRYGGTSLALYVRVAEENP